MNIVDSRTRRRKNGRIPADPLDIKERRRGCQDRRSLRQARIHNDKGEDNNADVVLAFQLHHVRNVKCNVAITLIPDAHETRWTGSERQRAQLEAGFQRLRGCRRGH